MTQVPDFELPSAEGEPLAFDASYRQSTIPLLFFYRGYW